MAAAGVAAGGVRWIDQSKACDLGFTGEPERARAALEGLLGGVDAVVQPEAGRRKALLAADMDSTMIEVECVDELADYAGLGVEVAAVTERAMRGEMPFEQALAERVALLRGLAGSAIERCRDERIRITPGAKALVRTMRREGAYCLLVSGGFTLFADKVAADIGFDEAVANRLNFKAGALDGTVATPVLGAAGKRGALIQAALERRIALPATLAIGDGANDIPMLEEAGLGVAYRAKPAAAAAADARIEHCDLTALLYAQGYPSREWEAD